MNQINRTLAFTLSAMAFMGMTGCQTLNGYTKTVAEPSSNHALSGFNAQDNAIQTLVKQSVEAMERDELLEASRLLNLSLKLDITNPDLQLLNGLVYHLMGVRGDTSKFDLAQQGYEQSLKFNPGNLAARYQLGLLYADRRQFAIAQGHFAAVALHRSRDPAVLYNLASASYYARDPKTAEAAITRLLEVNPEAREQPKILKAGALILAAMDDREGARQFINAYSEVEQDTRALRTAHYRVEDWQSFYDSDLETNLRKVVDESNIVTEDIYATPIDPNADYVAPYVDPNEPEYEDYSDSTTVEQSSIAEGNDGFVDSSMVVVDVVLIGTQEDIRNSRGINLLNGLQLQFGDPLTGTPGFSFGKQQISDRLNTGLDEELVTRTRSISIPAVTYSLNIANSLDANNQVLAKPSLVAQNGQTSEFFSGTEILAAAVSGGNGDSVSVQKEVGVKLAVTPEILPSDMLRLHVVAERTFLTDPSNSVVFEFRLDTTKTNINSTVTMKFGETLILGGLSERELSDSADGVPVLMDIPVLNYLVSTRTERQFERSVMILLTPRRPHFAHQAKQDRAIVDQRLSTIEKDIQRLSKRYKDWYKARPTFDGIIDKLQTPEFFQEFRVGDVEIESWQKEVNQQDLIVDVTERLLKI